MVTLPEPWTAQLVSSSWKSHCFLWYIPRTINTNRRLRRPLATRYDKQSSVCRTRADSEILAPSMRVRAARSRTSSGVFSPRSIASRSSSLISGLARRRKGRSELATKSASPAEICAKQRELKNPAAILTSLLALIAGIRTSPTRSSSGIS